MKAFLVFALAACLVLLVDQTEGNPQFPGMDMNQMAGKFNEMFGGQVAETFIRVACKMQEPLQQACAGSIEWANAMGQFTDAMKA